MCSCASLLIRAVLPAISNGVRGTRPAAARPVFITGRMSTTPPAAEVKLELDLRLRVYDLWSAVCCS